MSFKRSGCYVAAGLGLLAVVALSVFSIGAAAELEDMRQGAAEGFELRGTYLEPGQNSGRFLSFAEGQEDQGELSWQAQDESGARASGRVERTPDPNLYVLIDSDGNEVGWTYLANASRFRANEATPYAVAKKRRSRAWFTRFSINDVTAPPDAARLAHAETLQALNALLHGAVAD
ncbi:hypothetical protein [Adlercreutzia sp. ZJ473]|uniref:hypothetical protein n=1 Tax=Adlercreutzia sp. ZJ473 TaxID=2722822 RepID=UPI0015528285|nr:hypothetical protein [Adlercreutzia sp. ZJ473]